MVSSKRSSRPTAVNMRPSVPGTANAAPALGSPRSATAAETASAWFPSHSLPRSALSMRRRVS
eukprot:scaffold53740_cov68-Phaeocystis_antarctica.AAC.8